MKMLGMKVSLLCGLLTSMLPLMGCLEDRKAEVASEERASLFEGVKAVTNLGGFPPAVKVEWNSSIYPISGYRVYALIKDPETNVNQWTAVSEVLSAETTSFLHSATDQVVPGQIITYKVQALDLNNVEDGNNKQKSTIVFDGIQDAIITGKTTATVTISTGVGSFNEIRIYAQPVRAGAAKKLVATAVGNVSTINVTGLKSGVNYKFTANAYIAATSSEDGNNVYKLGQTYSDSFGSGKTTDNDYKYQSVRLVQGFGNAPNESATDGQLTDRTIRITFNPFVDAQSNTKYRIIRGSGIIRLDTTTQTVCSATTNLSCVVCTVSGAGPLTCTDGFIAAPPKKYEYTVALVKTDPTTNEEWVEELPTTNAADFVFSAHVPPEYMVLAQRDSANYEMCNQLKSPPNPRKTNRCSYSGIGAVPYNSGPGKTPKTFDAGYYDFGYNLLVDRHMLACNWTRAPACGPNGCIGNVTVDANNDGVPEAFGVPSNAVGVDGNVFFALNHYHGPNCFIKSAGTWRQVTSENTASSLMTQAATVDPGTPGDRKRPVLHYLTADAAIKLCNAQGSEYGTKRLLRRREWVVSTPMAYLEGEPNALVDKGDRWRMQLGTVGYQNGAQILDSGQCANVSFSTYQTTPATIAQIVDPANERPQMRTPQWATDYGLYGEKYFIGSHATRNCVSRIGIQDPLPWNYNVWLSDQFSRPSITASPPPIWQGESSELDNGNRDFLGFAFNDSTLGPSLNDANAFTYYYLRGTNSANVRSFPCFNAALGIPLFGGGPGQTLQNYSSYLLGAELNPSEGGVGITQNATMLSFSGGWNNSNTSFMAGSRSSRWSFYLWQRNGTSENRVLCAIEAE